MNAETPATLNLLYNSATSILKIAFNKIAWPSDLAVIWGGGDSLFSSAPPQLRSGQSDEEFFRTQEAAHFCGVLVHPN